LLNEDIDDFESALADFEDAVALKQDYGFALTHSAMALAALGRRAESLKRFEQASQIDPDDIHNLYYWGMTLAQEGVFEQAIHHVNRAIQKKEVNDTEQRLVSMAALLVLRGHIKRDLFLFADSMEDFERAQREDADNPYVVLGRARTLSAMGDLESAEAELGSIIDSPSRPRSIIAGNRASIRNRLGRLAEAIEDYDRALAADPDRLEFLISRGCLKDRTGSTDSALQDYNKFLAKHPDDANGLVHRARAFFGKRQYDLALADYNRVLESDPRNTTALIGRGEVFTRSDNWPLAVADFKSALAIKPNDSHILWSMGAALDNEGKFADAEGIFRRIYLQEPSNIQALLSIGITKSQRGQSEAAIKDFREVRRQAPNRGEPLFAGMTSPDLLLNYETVIGDWTRSGEE
jgi:tetratricopeptide (TPR) repeat protein